MKTKVIPSILASKPQGGVLRAWAAGCSTGEEAYSLAIVFREAFAALKPAGNFKLQIFATDLDKDAIEKARTGIYPPNITADVSPDRIKLYFEKDEKGFKITREIRESIVFAPHNVIMDPPFTKLDILVCRNLLIYMEQDLQKKILRLFNYSLNPSGFLFLGSAETVGTNSQLFGAVDLKTRFFKPLYQGGRDEPLDLPISFRHGKQGIPNVAEVQSTAKTAGLNLQSIIDTLLLQHFAPAAVLTNDKGDIIYISGRTGKYLEPAAGKANLNIFGMAREGLRYELTIMFTTVIHQKGEITKKGLTVGTNGGKQSVDVTVKLIESPESLKGMVMIVFADVAKKVSEAEHADAPHADNDSNRQLLLEEELRQAKDEILIIREEMQTSEEELKSTNEEMQSSNEEMQSTNEELTTSKEEMQSLNEELQTVNQELQSKVSDLSQANNDMKNLLNSTDIATLFLDDELNIRRFTNRTANIIKLIASDIGRPITDITTDLHYPDLAEDARMVLQTLVFSEKQVSASDFRWFTVKIMPYRTQENRIYGLVITFTDISMSKKLEQELRESEERFSFLIDIMPVGSIIQDAEGTIMMANREAERITGISIEEMRGKTISSMRLNYIHDDGSIMALDEHPVRVALGTGQSVKGFVMGIVHPHDHNTRWIKVSASPRLEAGSGKASQVYMTFYEIPAPQ